MGANSRRRHLERVLKRSAPSLIAKPQAVMRRVPVRWRLVALGMVIGSIPGVAYLVLR